MDRARLRFRLALALFGAWVLGLAAMAFTSGVRPPAAPTPAAGAPGRG